MTDHWGATSVPGVWAAGVVAGWPSQAVVCAGSGAAVAIEIASAAKGEFWVDHDDTRLATEPSEPTPGGEWANRRHPPALPQRGQLPALAARHARAAGRGPARLAGGGGRRLEHRRHRLPCSTGPPRASPALTVIHGHFGSPGGARTAAASSLTVLAPAGATAPPPDWLLTTDCDVELPDDFVAGWAGQLAAIDGDEAVGAVNGGEEQGHLFDGLPNAAAASGAFGRAAARSEAAVGVINLNGVNHAVRTVAYLTAGPYLQPTALGPHGEVNLAGEDWDLGVRLRLAGCGSRTARWRCATGAGACWPTSTPT